MNWQREISRMLSSQRAGAHPARSRLAVLASFPPSPDVRRGLCTAGCKHLTTETAAFHPCWCHGGCLGLSQLSVGHRRVPEPLRGFAALCWGCSCILPSPPPPAKPVQSKAPQQQPLGVNTQQLINNSDTKAAGGGGDHRRQMKLCPLATPPSSKMPE